MIRITLSLLRKVVEEHEALVDAQHVLEKTRAAGVTVVYDGLGEPHELPEAHAALIRRLEHAITAHLAELHKLGVAIIPEDAVEAVGGSVPGDGCDPTTGA